MGLWKDRWLPYTNAMMRLEENGEEVVVMIRLMMMNDKVRVAHGSTPEWDMSCRVGGGRNIIDRHSRLQVDVHMPEYSERS